MALARTDLLGQVDPPATGNHGTTDFTSNAFTPPSSSLLVVAGSFIENAATTDPSSAFVISGGSLTWTQRQVQVVSPTSFPTLVKIWTAPVTTGASMSVTLSTGGRAAGIYAVSVVAYTGYDTTTPAGTSGTTSNGSTVTGGGPITASLTLAAAPATTSEVFAALAADRSTAGVTPGTTGTWTEIHDTENTDWGGLQTQTRTGSASTTVDWADARAGGGTIFNYVAAAVEIQAAASGSSPYSYVGGMVIGG